MKMHSVIKYAFAALLLLGANSSYAATYYQNGTTFGSSFEDVAEQACSKSANCHHLCGTSTGTNPKWMIYAPTSNVNRCEQYPGDDGTAIIVYEKYGSCPTAVPYEWADGICHSEEEVQSCPVGDTIIITQDFNATINPIISNNSCQYESISGTKCYRNEGSTATGYGIDVSCDMTYTSNGQPSTGSEPVGEPNLTPSNSPDSDAWTEPATESTTNTPPSTTTAPDTTETTTTTTTTVSNSGGTGSITNDATGEMTTISSTSGSGTSQTTTTTTTTHPDGSITIDETTITTTQPPTTVNTTISGNPPIAENTTITSPSGTTTTTTQTQIDSSGNVTSVSGSTEHTGSQPTGTGTGTDDETVEGNCGAPNQPACDVSLEGEDELGDPSGTLDESGIIEQLTEFTTSITDNNDDGSGTAIPSPQLFNLYAGQTCDPTAFGVDYHGEPFDALKDYCPIHEQYVRPIMRWAFYMLTLIGLYAIFIKTFRKS